MNTFQEDAMKQAIFAELGVANFPDALRREVLAAAMGPVTQSVTLAILAKLPVEVQEQFKTAVEKGDGAAAERLIAEHIPDSTTFMGEEIKKATAEFRSIFKKQLEE